GVAPAPRHHARHLREVDAGALQLVADVAKIADFKIQPHALAGYVRSRRRLMNPDSTVPSRRAQPRVHRRAFVAKILDELEAQPVAVEGQASFHIARVEQGV